VTVDQEAHLARWLVIAVVAGLLIFGVISLFTFGLDSLVSLLT
jgi:hypothetical protein